MAKKLRARRVTALVLWAPAKPDFLRVELQVKTPAREIERLGRFLPFRRKFLLDASPAA